MSKPFGFDGIYTGHDEKLIPLSDIDEAIDGAEGVVSGTRPGEDIVISPGWPERNIRRVWSRHMTIDYIPGHEK